MPTSKDMKDNLKGLFIEVVDGLDLKHPVAELAQKTGYSKGNISEFLNQENKKEPSRAFLINFCKAFSLDFPELFGNNKSPKTKNPATLPEDWKEKYIAVLEEQRDATKALIQGQDAVLKTASAAIQAADAATLAANSVRDLVGRVNDLQETLQAEMQVRYGLQLLTVDYLGALSGRGVDRIEEERRMKVAEGAGLLQKGNDSEVSILNKG